jgi:outer membrane receptor protein involved in Fe transport
LNELAKLLLVGAILVYPLAAPGAGPKGEFPDQAEEEEAGGLLDEFALLEEELSIDVVESASKHRQSIFWSPSAITVFTKDDIRASGADDLPDLLRRVPGFDIYRLKPGFPLVGARTNTNVANNLILLLVDGREYMIETTGFTFWTNTTIDLEEVERVEVIRGPGSALYGANAFAGVVSITTVAGRPDSSGDVYISMGESGHQRLFGRIRRVFELEGARLSLGVGVGMSEEGFPSHHQDAGYYGYRAHGYLRYQDGERLDLSLHAGSMWEAGGLAYMSMGDINAPNAIYHFVMGKAAFALPETARLQVQLYHARHESDLAYRAVLQAYDIWIADVPRQHWITDTVDAQLQFDWRPVDGFLFIAGSNLRYNTMETQRIILEDDDELRGAGFLHLEWNPWEVDGRPVVWLTGGLRLDFNTSTRTALSPRAAVVFGPWSNHTFRLSYGLAFRRPSYFEHRMHVLVEDYNPGTPEIVEKLAESFGNNRLLNEKVHTFEAGWRGRFLDDHLRVCVDLFYSLYADTIAMMVDIPENLGLPDIANSTLQFQNKGAEVNALGGEAELVWRPSGDWNFWCNLGVRRVTDRSTKKRMPAEPQLRVNLGVGFRPRNGWHLDVALHYVSAYQMPRVDPDNILENQQLIPLGEEVLVLARAGYRLRVGGEHFMEAGLALRAPLGNQYREFPGSPPPRLSMLDTTADFGGELVRRIVLAYLRVSF